MRVASYVDNSTRVSRQKLIESVLTFGRCGARSSLRHVFQNESKVKNILLRGGPNPIGRLYNLRRWRTKRETLKSNTKSSWQRLVFGSQVWSLILMRRDRMLEVRT